MIDFTNAIEEFNTYSGSEKKKTLIYDNIKYLVKFPEPLKNNKFKYNNISEYIGSNIFKMSGFETQNVVLGNYNYNEKR